MGGGDVREKKTRQSIAGGQRQIRIGGDIDAVQRVSMKKPGDTSDICK